MVVREGVESRMIGEAMGVHRSIGGGRRSAEGRRWNKVRDLLKEGVRRGEEEQRWGRGKVLKRAKFNPIKNKFSKNSKLFVHKRLLSKWQQIINK